MNLHRYKANIPSASTGDSHFEFLGTWIGLAGMIVFMIDTALFSPVKEAAGLTAVVIGSLSFIYWLTTQHKKLLYVLLFFLTSIVIVLTLGIAVGAIKYNETKPVLNLYSGYLSSVLWVTAYYANRMYESAPNNTINIPASGLGQ